MIWRPADLGAGWRQTVGDGIWSSIRRTWLPDYDQEARASLDQVLSRMIDGMTRSGEDPVSTCGSDGIIAFLHVDPAKVMDRGDWRYGSTYLAEFLMKNPSLDLVPTICGMRSSGVWVLDGHHRMRAYAIAKRKALTFLGRVVSGTGEIRLICESDADSGRLADQPVVV